MGAATCQIQLATGSGPSYANAEGGNTVMQLADSGSATTPPIAIPTTTGTVFSWIKNFVLAVTVTGTTNISNRNVYMSSSPSTGLALFWKGVAVASYAQAASGNRPASSGSNGATPSTYTAMTTSPVQYDNSSVSTGSTGPNGELVVVVLGVDNTYTGGAGSSVSLPSLKLQYDEA